MCMWRDDGTYANAASQLWTTGMWERLFVPSESRGKGDPSGGFRSYSASHSDTCVDEIAWEDGQESASVQY